MGHYDTAARRWQGVGPYYAMFPTSFADSVIAGYSRPGDIVPIHKLRDAIPHLRASIGAPVCCTRGADGMIVSDPEVTVISGVRLSGPIDPTGAGDSATAGAVLALASGASLPEAALVGCLVASITVQQLATTGTATPAQVIERLEIWREQNS